MSRKLIFGLLLLPLLGYADTIVRNTSGTVNTRARILKFPDGTISNSSGTVTVSMSSTVVTANTIPYANASGALVGVTTDLYWDATNHFMGMGTISPSYEIDTRRNVPGSQVGFSVQNSAANGNTIMRIVDDTAHGLLFGTAGTTFSAPYSGNSYFIGDGDIWFQPAAGKSVYTYPAGRGFGVKEGSNAKMGTFALSSGAAWVANTSITANSRVFLTVQTKSGTSTGVGVTSTTVSAGFNAFGNAGDNSTVGYLIFEAY